MNLAAITSVKNEIDVIEAFTRHTLAFVNRLVILDNGSRDGTLEVLRCLEKEFDSLEVVEDTSLGKYQARRMTRLLREYALGRYRADWVLPLDADEFLIVPPGAALVPVWVGLDKPVPLRWRTYVPDDSEDALLRQQQEQLRRSWTWRVGRLLVAPVARIVRGASRCGQAGRRLLRQFRWHDQRIKS
jgi:hypothetical protein